ncbi:hypothetical protein CRG98_017583 [Punica granatum]|uniref:Uncharacterized protein n=1 Tax=Punica granatum TaxID=22663 RepID=A0A2I0K0E8_PUNGR|nr:hypothetical protein CRG98_017583 [Punica granatum]
MTDSDSRSHGICRRSVIELESRNTRRRLSVIFLQVKASPKQRNWPPAKHNHSSATKPVSDNPTGVRPLRVHPDHFSAQGSVPFGYVPTTFLLRGHSLSGTSRLLFYSGVRPLWVRPDYFFAQGSVPFGYVPTTFLLRGLSPSGSSPLLFYSGVRLFRGSVPFGYVPTTFLLWGPSPSDTSRLLFFLGVSPFWIRPDYFSAQGSVPFGYVPATFLLRGPSP